MKILFIYIYFIAFVFTFSKVLSQGKILILKNTKTAKHINIPKTKIFLIPPMGFTVATGFIGLQKNETSIMQVMTGGNYFTDAASLSKKRFEGEGAKVFEEKILKINNYHAKFFCVQNDSLYKNIMLAFGDSTISLLFFLKYPVKEIVVEKQIKESLFSIVYDSKFIIETNKK